jgi:hypothetical protein
MSIDLTSDCNVSTELNSIVKAQKNHDKINEMFMQVCKNGYTDMISYMLSNDLVHNFNIQDQRGKTPLHYITNHWDDSDIYKNIVNMMLNKNTDKSFINMQDEHGNTAFVSAVMNGKKKLCSILDQHGAARNIANNEGLEITTDTISNIETDTISNNLHNNYNPFITQQMQNDNAVVNTISNTCNGTCNNVSKNTFNNISNVDTAATDTSSTVTKATNTNNISNLFLAMNDKPVQNTFSEYTYSTQSLPSHISSTYNTNASTSIMKGGKKNITGYRNIYYFQQNTSRFGTQAENSNATTIAQLFKVETENIKNRILQKIKSASSSIDDKKANDIFEKLNNEVTNTTLHPYDKLIEVEKVATKNRIIELLTNTHKKSTDNGNISKKSSKKTSKTSKQSKKHSKQ